MPAVFHIILRYIHEEPLRQAIQLQLNRGEFRHILAKWLFFANQGELRSGDYEEVMNKASCLSLLSNAVLVWNTVHMTRILARLRAAGQQVEDEDLARAPPWPTRMSSPAAATFSRPGAAPMPRRNSSRHDYPLPEPEKVSDAPLRAAQLVAPQPAPPHRQPD